MKKTLLLSVVASTMIMAGGDIAPVEPVIEAPVVEASGWDFSGQAVAYYQTVDAVDRLATGDAGLFAETSSAANVGLQLRAMNADIFYGFGAGVEVSALGTMWLESGELDIVSGIMQNSDGSALGKGGWISQAYLTYGFGNTAIKVGRQELPKALSPFAFSESWNVFKNTFEAALIVNTDISDTTLVGAWVTAANNHGDMGNFADLNGDDGVFMLTAQNKSVENLTVTGSLYYAPEFDVYAEDALIYWIDAKYNAGLFTVAGQGGYIDANAVRGDNDTVAYGAKVAANYDMFNLSAAYSYVNENSFGIRNLGTGVKTPLYTQMVANQGVISNDASYVKLAAGASALGGNFGLAYGMRMDSDLLGDNNPYEVDVTYSTKVFNDSTSILAAYVYADDDAGTDASIIRLWGRYNF
ncbi:MAG: hypothetical protein U9O24_04925 [Campylobacterota bacterium]|nr:hypothetical protein [Campylobacterota bacterium]